MMALGFLRKDVSIAMLAPFALPPGSIVVASVFLTPYLPCLASCLVTLRELGARGTALVVSLNLGAALLFASGLHQLLKYI